MSTQSRLERAEKRLNPQGEGELCTCQPPRVLVDPADRDYLSVDLPEPGPEVCPQCGRKRLTMRLEYASTARAIAAAMAKGAGDDETAQERTLRTLGEALAHMNGDADQTKTDERGQ